MNVSIDPTSGFCWGVVRTVQIAERYLADGSGRPLYVLGNIIHNPMEIERLRRKGLQTITHSDFDGLAGTNARVLIRAHGEPPSTYRQAFKVGVELVDATCPVVTKLQERVRKFYDDGFQVVIFGKREHAEVKGVRGVCNDECLVVKTVEQALETVDLDRPTVLFSQTTMDRPTFQAIRDALKQRISELVVDSHENIALDFHAKDTICGQVSGREDKLAAYAAANDVIVFVAGRESSNGKVLFNVARDANPQTYFIEDIAEIQAEWFDGVDTVGISGATSTPQWLMQKVRQTIEDQFSVASV